LFLHDEYIFGSDISSHHHHHSQELEWTPLFSAVAFGRIDMIRLLVRNGADLRHKLKFNLDTPRMYANRRGFIKTERVLSELEKESSVPMHHVLLRSSKKKRLNRIEKVAKERLSFS
jgi:ankyrin repeat protein